MRFSNYDQSASQVVYSGSLLHSECFYRREQCMHDALWIMTKEFQRKRYLFQTDVFMRCHHWLCPSSCLPSCWLLWHLGIGVREQFCLGSWGQLPEYLPEYFIHCLSENQVVYPEYYMTFFLPQNDYLTNSMGLHRPPPAPPPPPRLVHLCTSAPLRVSRNAFTTPSVYVPRKASTA